MSEHFIEEKNLSVAWGKALQTVSGRGRTEFSPLIVSITGFDGDGKVDENKDIRRVHDSALASEGKQTVETVASTIFPYNMWNKTAVRSQLFERYIKILPKLHAASRKNQHGLYFERMITGGPNDYPNQLEFVIDAYLSRNSVRRSMLQIGVFNPHLDVTTAAQRGFPCLQHIALARSGDELSLSAFYATQYIFERAYGNYLGLCRLGEFLAHEMNLKLARVTCFSGIGLFDGKKNSLGPTLESIAKAIAEKGE